MLRATKNNNWLFCRIGGIIEVKVFLHFWLFSRIWDISSEHFSPIWEKGFPPFLFIFRNLRQRQWRFFSIFVSFDEFEIIEVKLFHYVLLFWRIWDKTEVKIFSQILYSEEFDTTVERFLSTLRSFDEFETTEAKIFLNFSVLWGIWDIKWEMVLLDFGFLTNSWVDRTENFLLLSFYFYKFKTTGVNIFRSF